MQHISTKAIVLRTLPFKENQKIITVFSEDLGMASIIMKKIGSHKTNPIVFSELFCEAEFVCAKKNSDLLTFCEGEILNLHLPLRSQLSYLKTALSFATALLRSQMPGKPSRALYALLSSFLRQIPCAPNLQSLLNCFYLKILIHEGLYHPSSPAKERKAGEEYFSFEENSMIAAIASTRNFSKLGELLSPDLLSQKIENFFSLQIE